MAEANKMQIKYEQLCWAHTHLEQDGPVFTTHVVEETLPGGTVEYGVLPTKPDMIPGKLYYWTNTAGATSCRRYLGLLDVEIIEIPSWVGEDQCES